MSTTSNLTFRLNTTWIIVLRCKDAVNGALNLAGGEVVWRMSVDGEPILDLSSDGNGIAITDAANGVCTITVTPEMQEAAFVKAGYYWHQGDVNLASGIVSDQTVGSFQVLPTLFE